MNIEQGILNIEFRNILRCFLLFFTAGIIFTSCGEEAVIAPKPRGYPKVIYPQKAYQNFEEGYCQFTFEYPKYATVQQDTKFFDEKPKDPCWFDVVLPEFNARIHFTYTAINKSYNLDKLKTDAFTMVEKHNVKAKYIEEIPVKNQYGASGFLFNLEGEAASPCQFYMTDSTQHFVRGSLYFNTQARPDSLAPITDFLKKDIDHIIGTMKWR